MAKFNQTAWTQAQLNWNHENDVWLRWFWTSEAYYEELEICSQASKDESKD